MNTSKSTDARVLKVIFEDDKVKSVTSNEQKSVAIYHNKTAK